MYPSTGNTKNSDTHHKPSAGMGTMHDKRFKKLGYNIQNLKNRFNRSEPLWSFPEMSPRTSNNNRHSHDVRGTEDIYINSCQQELE